MYRGISDWWNSLETSSSGDQVAVQKTVTRGVHGISEEDMEYLTTTVTTERRTISDQAVPVPGQSRDVDEETQSSDEESTSSGRITHHQRRENKGNLSHLFLAVA